MSHDSPDHSATDVLDRLRTARARRGELRRAIERNRLQGHRTGTDGTEAEEVARTSALAAELAAVTEELIELYRADLSLVDSLLDTTYPANVAGGGSREHVGR